MKTSCDKGFSGEELRKEGETVSKGGYTCTKDKGRTRGVEGSP